MERLIGGTPFDACALEKFRLAWQAVGLQAASEDPLAPLLFGPQP